MLIMLKHGAASNIFSGEISRGSSWSPLSFKSCIWLSYNALPASHFFPSLKYWINLSSLPSVVKAKAHDFIEFATISVEISSQKPPWNWFQFSRSCIFMFCISHPIVIPFSILSLNSPFQTTCYNCICLIQTSGMITILSKWVFFKHRQSNEPHKSPMLVIVCERKIFLKHCCTNAKLIPYLSIHWWK